ncbi:hypothetical protein K8R33_03970 [archaeon]|nr:hypothetical protein [archaeon]
MTKEKFLKTYANLPEPERHQVIVIVDGKTYSWDRAYSEVTNDTKLGKEILKKLKEMQIL